MLHGVPNGTKLDTKFCGYILTIMLPPLVDRNRKGWAYVVAVGGLAPLPTKKLFEARFFFRFCFCFRVGGGPGGGSQSKKCALREYFRPPPLPPRIKS